MKGEKDGKSQNERKKSWKRPIWFSDLLAVWSEMKVAVSKRIVATCHLKQAAASGEHAGYWKEEGNQIYMRDSQKRRNLVRDPLSRSMGGERHNSELDTSHHSLWLWNRDPKYDQSLRGWQKKGKRELLPFFLAVPTAQQPDTSKTENEGDKLEGVTHNFLYCSVKCVDERCQQRQSMSLWAKMEIFLY